MNEQIVSYETAKLAKEKGFEGPCNHWACVGWGKLKENKTIKPYEAKDDHGYTIGKYTVSKVSKGQPHIALVPTQSLLQKWIRDKHKLHIVIIPTECGYFTFKLIDIQLDPENPIERPPYNGVCGYDFSSYEEALEAGLIEALKMIEK